MNAATEMACFGLGLDLGKVAGVLDPDDDSSRPSLLMLLGLGALGYGGYYVWSKRGQADEAVAAGQKLGIDWTRISPDEFRRGFALEKREHGASPETDVTNGGDPEIVAKLAWGHLQRDPTYYSKLARCEASMMAGPAPLPEVP